jgi:hypothetical protein
VARINVEDSLWSDARFMRLCVKLGDELRAAGAVLVAWKTAQKFWCPNRQPISEAAFRDANLPDALVEVGLAERMADGVRMRGSEEHFSWWFDKKAAGMKSAAVRKERFGSSQPSNTCRTPVHVAPNTPEQRSNAVEPLPLPLSPNTKRLNTKEVSTERSPSAERYGTIPEFSDPILDEFFLKGQIKKSTQLLWIKAYQDPVWIKQEFLKSLIWLDANSHKKPKKNYTRFLGTWLSRGWEWHRKNLPSSSSSAPMKEMEV